MAFNTYIFNTFESPKCSAHLNRLPTSCELYRPGRKKNGTRVVIACLNYEIFLWRAHAQNDLRHVFSVSGYYCEAKNSFFSRNTLGP